MPELYPDLTDDGLLERLKKAAGADDLEFHEQRAGDGWICTFRPFSVIPIGIAPNPPAVIATQGKDLRATREALLAQVEGEQTAE